MQCVRTHIHAYMYLLAGLCDPDTLHAALPFEGEGCKWIATVWIRQSSVDDGHHDGPCLGQRLLSQLRANTS